MLSVTMKCITSVSLFLVLIVSAWANPIEPRPKRSPQFDFGALFPNEVTKVFGQATGIAQKGIGSATNGVSPMAFGGVQPPINPGTSVVSSP